MFERLVRSLAMTKRGVPGRPDPDIDKPSVRHKVLKAAMEVIADVGPDRVRIQDIAARAGMSPGHVMYYFGKRDRILIDVLLHSEAELADRLRRRVASAPTPREALERVVRLYLPVGPADVRWNLWAQLFARPPRDAQTLRDVTAVTDQWASTIAAIVAEGAADGTFACGAPVEVAYDCARLMDGYSLEVLIGAPRRSRSWAMARVRSAIDRNLGLVAE